MDRFRRSRINTSVDFCKIANFLNSRNTFQLKLPNDYIIVIAMFGKQIVLKCIMFRIEK